MASRRLAVLGFILLLLTAFKLKFPDERMKIREKVSCMLDTSCSCGEIIELAGRNFYDDKRPVMGKLKTGKAGSRSCEEIEIIKLTPEDFS